MMKIIVIEEHIKYLKAMKIFNLLDINYNNFTNSVKSYLSKLMSNTKTSFGSNTIFGQLISVLANAVQNVMLYIEDSLVEQNKYTAQRKKSIYGLASLTGYKPFYGKAAGVELKMTFVPNNNSVTDVIINNREPVTCTQNGLQYNLILPQETILLSINNDNSDKYIYAVQGKFETQTFISNGGLLYTQNFKFLGNMDIDYLEVAINGEPWKRVDSIYDMDPDAKQYVYDVSNVSGAEIVFGNDVYGRSLKNGDVIKITYLVHDGEVGNITPDNETYFVFNNDLTNIFGESVNGNSIFNVTFASDDPVTSGSNSESINQVKHMIGLNSRSLVLSSAENYKSFINRFSFCGYSKTWSEKGSLIVNSIIIKNYKKLLSESKDYFNLTENDFYLSEAQKASIINYIKTTGSQYVGTTYNIVDPKLCKYAIYMYVKVKNTGANKVIIENKIRNLVGEFFCNIDEDMFISKSDIVYLIKNNISDIESIDMYILSERNETALINKYYDNDVYEYSPVDNTYNIKKEQIYLYDGENPNLGLDNHGNIFITQNVHYPILMGGWKYLNNNGDLVSVVDPLIITFE